MTTETTHERRVEREEREAAEERVAKALGHPYRVRIMEILNEEEAAASDMAREMRVDPTLILYHVRVLRTCGFVEFVETPIRTRNTYKKPLRSLAPTLFSDFAWAALDPRARSAVSNTVLENVMRRVGDSIAAQTFDAKEDRHLTLQTVSVDWSGWDALRDLMAETMSRVDEIAERPEKEGAEFPVTLALLSFESPKMYEKRPTNLEGGGTPLA